MKIKSYKAWDASVRWFHWINVLCIIGLVAVGIVIMNGGSLGLSNDGKILLKTVHVLIGYVFAFNLFLRLLLAFVGNKNARWKAILPGGKGYLNEVKSYASAFKAGRPQQYIGHNPLGRISVVLLLFLLFAQAVTGLILAGTDIFYPPFGSWIADWIAKPGVDPTTLLPYAKSTYDAAAYDAMRAFRAPFIEIHEIGFYALLCSIVIHIIAVVITEIREGGTLISAMFTGKKILTETPKDLQELHSDKKEVD